ncbi:DUF6262 family protein [Streptomyces sp. NPDC048191]|uniref:DUF6262 family protein n=1 Tax=Streptomyces sp. NPDC048191 TaxID=3155484 RepID=UPI0033CD4F7D
MSDHRQQRIDALKAAARRRSQEKVKAAETAIRDLCERGEQVTFQAVQRQAGVSLNFLYKTPELRARIEHQRRTYRPPLPPPPPAEGDRTNTAAADPALDVARLNKRHHQEVAQLRKALAQARAQNLALRRELERRRSSPR